MAENLRALGRIGEEAAARYLVNAGYAMVGRNVYIGKLEADILCVSPDGLYLCFVEVKTRRIDPSDASTRPADAVDGRKRTHMLAFARAYMAAHPETFAARYPRLDVVEVYLSDGDAPSELPSVRTVRHYPGAVRPARNYQKHRNE